jgi:hypothetical protein
MYDEYYKGMEKAGVATRLDEPIWVDNDQVETNMENAAR